MDYTKINGDLLERVPFLCDRLQPASACQPVFRECEEVQRILGDAFLGGFELGVRATEIFDLVVLEMPDAGGDFVDQVLIVGDQQDRAFVALQRDIQGVDRLPDPGDWWARRESGNWVSAASGGRRSGALLRRRISASVIFSASSPLNSIWPSSPRNSSARPSGRNHAAIRAAWRRRGCISR